LSTPARSPPDPRRLRVSLRQLEAFCAVALVGSVSGAAVRLSRTQSAVSSTLAELESSLGTRLFERVGRRLQPTDASRRLLPKALEIVERAAELPALAADDRAAAERLSIGASRTIGPYVMPELLASFLAAHPLATIELAVANTQSLVASVRNFELDLALVEGSALESDLSVERWLTDELCLFARAGHPQLPARRRAAARDRVPVQRARRPAPVAVTAAALAAARWATREPGSGTRETFLRAMAPVIGAPAIGLEVSDPQTLKRFVSIGDWFGCLGRRAIADELASGELVELRAPDPAVQHDLTRHFWIVRHPQRYRTATLDALSAHIAGWRD
jgi:DNA-binding transcriptional LysR family regulator